MVVKDNYLYWLDGIEGLGAATKKNLMDAFGSGEAIFRASENHLKFIVNEKKLSLLRNAKKREPLKMYEEAKQAGIHMLCCFDEAFPEKLLRIPDAPFALYFKGKLPTEQIPSVAVIGARECSSYGEYVAGALGKLLGQQGIQVISGMAKGIDGISQIEALEAGGVSYGVLGCGVDVCYPKSNRKLYEKLIERGGILSTYPPGTQPQAKLFPPRNRIVSGLADVLVVIEARQKSGTYITVEMALEQGREIYAVPGRVTDRLSDGCNKMLKDGAHVFLSPQDFLMDLKELLPGPMEQLQRQCLSEDYSIEPGGEKRNDLGMQAASDEETIQLLSVLDFYPQSVEEIALQIQKRYRVYHRPEELTTKLMLLCLYGQAKQETAGWFRKACIKYNSKS